MATPDSEIEKRREELEICRSAVDFFLKDPLELEYLAIEKRAWLLFLQSRFPDENGQWFGFDLFRSGGFLNNITRRIEAELRQLPALEAELKLDEKLPPSIPPNLPELVKTWEEAKASGEKEKKIKKSLTAEIEAAQRAIITQWEAKKYENQIKNDLTPQLEKLQQSIIPEIEIEGVALRFDEIKEIPKEELAEAIRKETTTEKLEWQPAEKEVSKAGIREILETALEKNLRKQNVSEERTKEISNTIAQKISEYPSIVQSFQNQAPLLNLVEFNQRRKDYLEKIVKGEPLTEAEKKQSFEEIPVSAWIQTQEFVRQTFASVKADLINKLGLSETEIDQLGLDTARSIASKTFLSQNPTLFTQPEAQLTESLKQAFSDAFEYNLRRPAIRNFISALKNTIIPSRKLKAANEILAKTRPDFANPPPALISTIKTATFVNYGLAKRSIEAGNPLGRLPSYVLREITVLPDILEKLPPDWQAEIRKRQIFGDLKDPTLEMKPGDFAHDFQGYWALLYHPAQPLSASQLTAIQKYVAFLQGFQRSNPAGFRVFRFYQKHVFGISWGRLMAGYFIKYPDYFLHFPFIFGKFWFYTWRAQKWEYVWKPKVFGFIINRVPGIGQILGFLYKRDEWGLWQGPITRIKKKVQKFILQKGIGGTGRFVYRLGQLLGKTRLGQALMSWGSKLIGIASTGGIGALLFAFYPFFKRTLKYLAYLFGLITLGILHWAMTYGPAAVAGWGVGTIGGALAGIKVGSAVFGATFGFLGPFAIIPAVIAGGITWVLCQIAGASLGILLTKIWLGLRAAFSSLFAPGVAETGLGGTGMISEATAALPQFATPVLATTGATIVGGSLLLNIITSSTFVAPTEKAGVPGPAYLSQCWVKDIHDTATITEEYKKEFVKHYMELFPHSLLADKIDYVIQQSIAAGFSPALAIAIWGEESHFSNYSEGISPGHDFGCAIYGAISAENRPQNFEESLACFLARLSYPKAKNACLDKPDFDSFMDCYGPGRDHAKHPLFVQQTLIFYIQLDPEAVECPGGLPGLAVVGRVEECHLETTDPAARLACQIEKALNYQSLHISNLEAFINKLPAETREEIRYSVKENDYLQCVGFKIAVEEGLTREYSQNACQFLTRHPCQEISSKEVEEGDNAVWGNLAACSRCNEKNLKACGHIAVVTKVFKNPETGEKGNFIQVTQAWGQSGVVDSRTVPINDPDLYLRCH